MSGLQSRVGRCHRLGISAWASAVGIFLAGTLVTAAAPSADESAIRPFKFHATDAALSDLRRRVAATRWPEQESLR